MPEQISILAVVNVLGVLVMALFGFFVNRAFNKQDEHDTRIRNLEASVATKEDIDGVYSRLNTLGDQMNSQHQTILHTLLKGPKG